MQMKISCLGICILLPCYQKENYSVSVIKVLLCIMEDYGRSLIHSVRLCIHLITMVRIMAVYEIQRLPYMNVLFCGIVTREMKVAI